MGECIFDANGVQSRKFSIRDGMGITQLLENDIEVGLISFTRSQTIVEERARMLGIRFVFAGKEP